eukprot:CAMPEP_0178975142 /NCGR_PEP_ID=MMETSP0789-20121207/22953_1 /TAXON_ID=3005 /ORGANISM="Rhizosolenia setigera, Strain CCMP 1694" /LENGTH=719 /DNA_ID=CAMNT_0020663765 /DNA_START=409 /DNA_END=2568 /DNA_ORIENTATION=+
MHHKRRQLDEVSQEYLDTLSDRSSYEPLRMTFVTDDMEELLGGKHDTLIKFLLRKVLPGVNKFYKDMLSVIPSTEKWEVLPDVCFGEIKNIPENLLEGGGGIDDTDMIVFVQAVECGGMGTIAAAAPCELSFTDLRPVIGIVYFCLDSEVLNDISQINKANDSGNEEIAHAAVEVTVHELAHVVGMNSDLLPFFLNRETGKPYLQNFGATWRRCVDDRLRRVLAPSVEVVQEFFTERGARYFEVVTPTVKQVVKNQFGCQDQITGARLENQPTLATDCYGSHWDERLYFTESLGAFYGTEQNSLSPLTVALLEDTGWFYGNYSVTSVSTFGLGAGCDFVEQDCIDSQKMQVPESSRGFFCDQVGSLRQEVFVNRCTPTHLATGFCDLFDFEADSLNTGFLPPTKFTYFEDENLSPVFFDRADFCPVSIPVLEVNDCRIDVDSQNPKNEICINIEMEDQKNEGLMLYGAQCADYKCNEDIKKVQVIFEDEEPITCDFDFQKHVIPNVKPDGVMFECPRVNVVCSQWYCPDLCSGRGICNTFNNMNKCECFDTSDKSPNCDGTLIPTSSPTKSPSMSPTKSPTYIPTLRPTQNPTGKPSRKPTALPTTSHPTQEEILSLTPTFSPTVSTTTSTTLKESQNPTLLGQEEQQEQQQEEEEGTSTSESSSSNNNEEEEESLPSGGEFTSAVSTASNSFSGVQNNIFVLSSVSFSLFYYVLFHIS